MKKSLLFMTILTISPVILAETLPEKIEYFGHTKEKQAILNARLMDAIYQGDANKVRALLTLGASVESRSNDEDQELALLAAIRVENLEVVKALVDGGAKINASEQLHTDIPAIHAVARTLNIPLLKYLIEKGIDVNKKNAFGSTALMEWHMAPGVTEFTKVLIEAGADLNAKDKKGNTALAIFLNKKIQVESGNNQARLKTLELLIDSGADLNTGVFQSPLKGMSTLAYAISVENTQAVKLLSEAGAVAWEGESLLSIAGQKRNLETVKFLIDLGADDLDQAFFVTATTSNSGYKYTNHPMEIEEYFLQKGANPNIIDSQTKLGVLHLLSNKMIGGDSGQLQWLLDHGLNPNLKDHKNQSTPMAYLINYWFELRWSKYFTQTAMTKEVERVKRFFNILQESDKFDINFPVTKEGYTALQYAVIGTHRAVPYRLDLIKLLVGSGADITIKTPEGLSLLDLAKNSSSNDRFDIVNYLVSIGVK